jgi:hypothetical protein
MTAEQIFSVCNLVAMLGWILLIFLGRKRWVTTLVTGFAIPLLLGILYAALVARNWGGPGGFGSLAQVSLLFENKWMLLAGWIHYLAFDLFTGTWEVRDAQEKGVPHLAVIPSLGLTFMFGPAGLLLYFATRAVFTRSAGLQRDPVAQL